MHYSYWKLVKIVAVISTAALALLAVVSLLAAFTKWLLPEPVAMVASMAVVIAASIFGIPALLLSENAFDRLNRLLHLDNDES